MMKSSLPSEYEMSDLSSANFLASSSSSIGCLNVYSISPETSDFNSSEYCCKNTTSDDEAFSHLSEPDHDSFEFIPQETPHLSPDIQQKLEINMEISGTTLKIDGKTPRENHLNLSSLKKIRKLKVDFTDFLFIEGQIRQLALLLENLKKVKKVKLIIRNQKNAPAIQQQLKEIFSKLQKLKSVKFDFYRSGVASGCVDYLSKEVIPKLETLKSFHINLYDSDIQNENVQKLAWSLNKNFEKLEDFRCNLGQTKVTEKVIVHFFHEMPKMKKFELNIGNCVFTDYGMKIFIRNTLKSMQSLEKFTFLLEATDFMSAQLIELFKNLPETIQKLRIDLRWTRTTSESLKVFMSEKLPRLAALEEAELKVDCTLASKKMKEIIDGVNRKFARKINAEECRKYQQMIKEKYSM